MKITSNKSTCTAREAQALAIQKFVQGAFLLANFFFSNIFFREKTGEVEVNCYRKMCDRPLCLLTMLFSRPDIPCVRPLALLGFSRNFIAKIGKDPKKSYHLSAGPLALCRIVNLALVIALR